MEDNEFILILSIFVCEDATLKIGVPSHLRSNKTINPISSDNNVSNIRISLVTKGTDALSGVFDLEHTAIEDNFGLAFQTLEQDSEYNLPVKKYYLLAKPDNVSKRVEKISEFQVVNIKNNVFLPRIEQVPRMRLSGLCAVVRPYNIALRWGRVRFDLIVNPELVGYRDMSAERGIQDAGINDLMGVLGQDTNGNIPASTNRPLIYPNDPIGMSIHDHQSNGTYLMHTVLPPANTMWLPAIASAIPRTPCPWPGCSESFIRSTDVDRHVGSIHWVSSTTASGSAAPVMAERDTAVSRS